MAVIKRSEGHWSVVYRVNGGKQIWKSGLKTSREAKAYEREVLHGVRQGTHVEESRLTFASFVTDTWLPSLQMRGVRPSTIAAYRHNLDRWILPALGNYRLQLVDGDDLNRLYARMLDAGLSPKSVRNAHGIISSILASAAKKKKVKRNVAPDADLPRVEHEELEVWEPAQLQKFLAYARENDPHLSAAWQLLCATGMRRSELLGLRWEDLDWTTGRLTIVRGVVPVDGEAITGPTKTKAGFRLLFLDTDTVAALKKHMGSQNRISGDMFVAEDGTPLDPSRFSARFQRLAKAAGLTRIRLHSIRHSVVSYLLQEGVPILVVSKRIGHSNVSTTLNTYGHLLPGADEQAAEITGNLLRATPLLTNPEQPVGITRHTGDGFGG